MVGKGTKIGGEGGILRQASTKRGASWREIYDPPAAAQPPSLLRPLNLSLCQCPEIVLQAQTSSV